MLGFVRLQIVLILILMYIENLKFLNVTKIKGKESEKKRFGDCTQSPRLVQIIKY